MATTTNNNATATANNVNNANAQAMEIATDAINNAILQALKKQRNATEKAETSGLKAGTMKSEIKEAKKSLKATLVAIRDIANKDLKEIPAAIYEGSAVDRYANELIRESLIKANKPIQEAQKILKALEIDPKQPITREIANNAKKIITPLIPVQVTTPDGGKQAGKLVKIPFGKLDVYKAEYYYITPATWDEVITEIFITNKGQAPTQLIEVSEFTTTPKPAEGIKGNGPIFSKVNGKMMKAKEGTEKGIFERWENIQLIDGRLRRNHADEAGAELLKETAKYKTHKV